MKDPTFWMLARASGLLAYAALTAATLLGLLVKARPFRSLSRATVTDLHRFVALIGLGALATHGVALVLDTTMPMPVARARDTRSLALPSSLDGGWRHRR